MRRIWVFILLLAFSSQLSAVSFSDSQIQHYEKQIRLADSLYKNYLPQYNFEEVKAAVMFFDSLRALFVCVRDYGTSCRDASYYTNENKHGVIDTSFF